MIQRLLILFMLISPYAFAGTPSAEDERKFLWNQANRLMFSASESADYLEAATRYAELIEQGAHNADVFYNLGTALLRAERYEEAIAAFERAEIYEGTTTDIQRNQRLARKGLNGDTASGPAWKRALFLWHYILPATVRGMVAALAFSLIWMALALKRLAPGYRSPAIIGICALVCILFSSSFGISMVRSMQSISAPTIEVVETPEPA